MKMKNILFLFIAILTIGLVVACSDDVVAAKDNNLNAYRVIESNGAFVYNGVKYETLQDALNAIKDGKSVGPEKVITATRDVISPAVTVADGQSVALDLGGHTITFYGVEQSALTIGSESLFGILNGTLTLQDTENKNLAVIYAKDASFLGLSDVTVNAEGQNALVADGVGDVFVTDGSSITGDTTVDGGSFFLGRDGADTSSMNGLTTLFGVYFNSDESTSVEGTLIETGSYLEIDNEMDADIKLNGVSILEVGPNGHATISAMDSSDGKTIVSSQGEGAITNNSGKAIPVVTANAKISRDDGETYSYYASISAAVDSLDKENLSIIAMANLSHEGTLEPAYSVIIDLAGCDITADISTAKALTLTNSSDDAAVFTGDISAAGLTVNAVVVDGSITSTGNMESDSSEFNGEISITGNLTDGSFVENVSLNGSTFKEAVTVSGTATFNNSEFRPADEESKLLKAGTLWINGATFNATSEMVFTVEAEAARVQDENAIFIANTTGTIGAITASGGGNIRLESVTGTSGDIKTIKHDSEAESGVSGTITIDNSALTDPASGSVLSTGDLYAWFGYGTGANSVTVLGDVTLIGGTNENTVSVEAIAYAKDVVTRYAVVTDDVCSEFYPAEDLTAEYTVFKDSIYADASVTASYSTFGDSVEYDGVYAPVIYISNSNLTLAKVMMMILENYEGVVAPADFIRLENVSGTIVAADVKVNETVDYAVGEDPLYFAFYLSNSGTTANLDVKNITAEGGKVGEQTVDAVYINNGSSNNIIISGVTVSEVLRSVDATNGDIYIGNSGTGVVTISGKVETKTSGDICFRGVSGKVVTANADVVSAESIIAEYATLNEDVKASEVFVSINSSIGDSDVDVVYAPVVSISDSNITLGSIKGSATASADLIRLVNVGGTLASAYVEVDEEVDYSAIDYNVFYLSNVSGTAALSVGEVTAKGGTVDEQAIQAVFVSNASANGLALASIVAPKGNINIDGTSDSAPVTVYSAVNAEDGSITADFARIYGSVSSPVSFTATHSTIWDNDDILLDNVVYAPVISITEDSKLNLNKLSKDADTAADEIVLNVSSESNSYVGSINAVKLNVTSENNKLTISDTAVSDKTTINGGTFVKTALSGTTVINGGVFTDGTASVDHVLSGKTTIAGGEFSGCVTVEGEDTNISNTISGGIFADSGSFVYNSRGNLLITGGMFNGTTSIERGTGEIKGTCDKDLDPCSLYFAHLDIAVNEWYIRSAKIDVVDSDNLNALSSKIVQASGTDYVYINYKASELNDLIVTPNSSYLRVVLNFDSVVTKQTKVKIDSRAELSGVIKLVGGDYNKLYSNKVLATAAATPVGIVVNYNSPSDIVTPEASEDPTYPSIYWIPNEYWVNFYKEKTSTNPATQRFYLNEAQDLRKNDYTREHYTFQGWDTADTATTVVYADRESYTFTSATESTLKLYAVWQPDTRSISYTPDHCTFSDKTEIYEYSETDATVFVFSTSPDEGYTVTSISASVAGVTVVQYEESGVPVANKWQVTIPKQTFENVVLYASSTNVYDIVYPIPGTNCYISDMTANSYTYDKDNAFEFYFRITPYTGYEVKAEDITSDRPEGTVVFEEVSDGYFKGTIKKQTLGAINITVTPTPIVYNVTLAGTTAKYSVTPKNAVAPYYTYTFGTQQVFTIAPNSGYMVTALSVTGADVVTAQSGDNWTVTVPVGTYGALTIDATVNPKIIYSATNCSIAATSGTLPQYYVEGTGVSFDAIASYNSTYQFKEYSVTSGVTMTETASAAGSKTYSVSISSAQTGAVEIAVTVNPVYNITCLNNMTGDAANCDFFSDKTTYTYGTQTEVVVTAKDHETTQVQTGWFNWDHDLSVSDPVDLGDGYKWIVTIPASYSYPVNFTLAVYN